MSGPIRSRLPAAASLVALALCVACESAPEAPAVFDDLWTHVDEHYAFFEIKDVDWDEVRARSIARLADDPSGDVLFAVCRDALLALEDGHVAIDDGRTRVAYDYAGPTVGVFSSRVLDEIYLGGHGVEAGALTYGLIGDTVGYLRVANFRGALDFGPAVEAFRAGGVGKVVVDVRGNPGGNIGTAQHLLERLHPGADLVGFYRQRSGPARDAFTAPAPITLAPMPEPLGLPVAVLTNRGSYSAATVFAGMAAHLPGFTLVGQVTGGGGGGAQSYQLPNGWVVDLPHGYFLDAEGAHVEPGVAPDHPVSNTLQSLDAGVDAVLEAALKP